jgi:hypothetical protein
MLKNPYLTPDDPGQQAALRFATYLNGEDKALLMSIRPVRGTMQSVVNNLIRNLCNELRELNITHYHPDADDILAVLIEPRPLSTEQFERLGRTTACTIAEVSARIHEHRRRTEVREGTANPTTGADNPKKQATRGVKPPRTKNTKTKKDTEAQS